MEAARPGGRRRRSRRGTVERPLNARLVRVAAIVVAPALLALLFSISTTGTLPRPPLDPIFDTASAEAIATELSIEHPSRVPGTPGAEDAALWYRETVATLGLRTSVDTWTADLPDLGEVQLSNIVTVVAGRSDETIVVVAHRDNAGGGAELGDNASGTAALVEIARGYAPQETAPPLEPRRTLVLVSADGGAWGGAGAARFAGESPYADAAIAAIVLQGLGGRGRPRVVTAGDAATSSPRTLVSTAAARVEEQVGVRPLTAPVLGQLVDLGIPFASGGQGTLLGNDIAAITLTTSDPGDPDVPAGDVPGRLAAGRLGGLGRSTEALIASLDASVGATFSTSATLYFDDRAASGWAIRLTLIVAIVPFVLGVVDLLLRGRRQRLRLRPAFRGLRARFLFALYAGLVVWAASLAGVFPTGEALPLPSHTSLVTDWPVAGVALAAVAIAIGWLVARRQLVPRVRPSPEDRLAGYAAALTWLAAVSIVVALVKPFAVLFILPSLYAWLWLPLRTRLWQRVAIYLAGLLGPVVGILVLADELGFGLVDTMLYVVGLVTVGYIPLSSVVLALAWAATALQLAALAFGRYAPYAAGADRPPAGPLRRGVRWLVPRRGQTAT